MSHDVQAALDKLYVDAQLPFIQQKFASAGFGDAVSTPEDLMRAYQIGCRIYVAEQQQQEKRAEDQRNLMKLAYDQLPAAAAQLGINLPSVAEFDGTADIARQLLADETIKSAAVALLSQGR